MTKDEIIKRDAARFVSPAWQLIKKADIGKKPKAPTPAESKPEDTKPEQ